MKEHLKILTDFLKLMDLLKTCDYLEQWVKSEHQSTTINSCPVSE